MNELSV